jgi:hypothetical protein
LNNEFIRGTTHHLSGGKRGGTGQGGGEDDGLHGWGLLILGDGGLMVGVFIWLARTIGGIIRMLLWICFKGERAALGE